jgi:hypothetical protein
MMSSAVANDSDPLVECSNACIRHVLYYIICITQRLTLNTEVSKSNIPCCAVGARNICMMYACDICGLTHTVRKFGASNICVTCARFILSIRSRSKFINGMQH